VFAPALPMPLTAGQTLSSYEILGPLGAGAMGEVYRARDTRLAREVAIKVLPEDLSGDRERRARFEREARSLAALNHSGVAQVFGVDESDGIVFMAMELVPGEDLATRLDRGALPVKEALALCRQIAEGLEAAHEAGVIHRDLKPANIRVTPNGDVKLLDFGLARPVHAAEGGDSVLRTEEGVVLGTPTYMSPEQARGKPVDRRTDVWAFGCVLYECLTGKRAFPGDSISDVIAGVLQGDADLACLPADLPPRVRELIELCLRKDPKERLQHIGEARATLAGLRPDPRTNGSTPSGPRRLPWPAALVLVAVAAGLGVILTVALTGGEGGAIPSTARAARIHERPLHDTSSGRYMSQNVAGVAVSPVDPVVAYGDQGQLWLWDLRELDPRPVEGTQGALESSFSPDGASLCFVAEGALWMLHLNAAGSRPSKIAATPPYGDLLWWRPDTILHPSYVEEQMGVQSYPVSGGEPRWTPQAAPIHGVSPGPTGAEYLISLCTEPSRLEVQGGPEPRTLLRSSVHMTQVASGGGILVIARDDGLWGARLPAGRELEESNLQRLFPEGSDPVIGGDLLAFVRPGTSPRKQFSWVDAGGKVLHNVGPEWGGRSLRQWALSPDGSRLAVVLLHEDRHPVESTLEVLDLDGSKRTTVARARGIRAPYWVGGQRRLLWREMDQDEKWRGFSRNVDSRLAADEHDILDEIMALSPDGRDVYLSPGAGFETEARVLRRPLTGEGESVSVPARRVLGLSPDGRFLVGLQGERGVYHLEISSVSDPGRSYRLPMKAPFGDRDSMSVCGWDGATHSLLCFDQGRGELLRMPVDPESGEPAPDDLETVASFPEGISLDQENWWQRRPWNTGLDLEEGRFLVLRDVGEEPRPTTLVVIENWSALLE